MLDIIALLQGFQPGTVIILYFMGAIGSKGAKPEAFVYAIIQTIFIFFNTLALNRQAEISRN